MPISLHERLLVDRMALDTSVLIPALDEFNPEARAPLCRTILESLLRKRVTVCIPAPAMAESMLGGGLSLRSVPRVDVLPFDALAAEVLASRIGGKAVRRVATESGLSKHLIKYDAMIIATCIAHGASCLVSADTRYMKRTADLAGLKFYEPADLQQPSTP